ncbi:PRD domain-containing protein [Agromyces intestinalis]|uniref:PRD domain-containing protein n=1 Tax=Agromyces intestinalis TaxID=2592652 RepID=A0A5C1YII0_9MICO|nr:PTS sugar transporter subunit IIA [Agromyces intestinalis]QEO15170.1 PRD domain-containing protein [Agromyces intestinalis]
MPEGWRRLVDELARSDDWTTAAELAARLDVTSRSIRSWAAQANGAGPRVVRSGPDGYRLDHAALAERAAAEAERADERPADRPEGRVAQLVRRLVDADHSLDVYEIAAAMHVSDSTLESDLSRVRARVRGTGLSLERRGSTVRLTGPESASRRLLGALLREESARGRAGIAALRRRFPELPGFREALVAELDRAGYAPNEYALDDVLLHVVIAVDRITRDRTLEAEPVEPVSAAPSAADGARDPAPDPVEELLGRLVDDRLGVRLPASDRAHLARLLRTRAATRRVDGAPASDERPASPRSALVRGIVARAASEYLVELEGDDFIERLALHIDHLAERSAEESFSRNPLTAQIKTAYPLIYELGVYVASELRRTEGIRVNDDEIAYLAMHLGARLDRRRAERDEVRVRIDAPAYHDLRETLAKRVRAAAGEGVLLTDGSPADLVVAVVPPVDASERVVLVGPLPTEDDLERVRAEIVRMRRARRTARLAARLSETIEPGFFVRGMRGLDREDVIRLLGDRLIDAGVVDRAYVDGAVERERMSSTAFADHLAVPHAMTMTATRTGIAIAVDDVPVDWAGSPVHVVALIAFSDSGRAEFQEVFDQFVETFSERQNVLRLVKGATDYPGLVAELTRLMDALPR